MNTILRLDATAQAALIRKGEISALELVNLSIDAIEELNPQLNAVITPMYDEARTAAENVDKNAPFAGVPMLLKDGIAAYKGVRMTSGSGLFQNFVAQYDSELVVRFKNAGFIVIGKTNMPEFGLMPVTEPHTFGATRNPWNTDLTPGGSSGGSAAAVAARIVSVAHGNDGGGSIRIPASCCGLFGLKPTRGRNPLGPNFSELISGLVAEHVLTRSVRDSAAILDLTEGNEIDSIYYPPPKSESYLEALSEPVRKLKIGYCLDTPMGGNVHDDCRKATVEAVELCQSLGHEVFEMPLKMPFNGRQIGEIFTTLWAAGATSALAMMKKMTGKEPPKTMVEPLTWGLYQLSQQVNAADYELARLGMHKLARSIMTQFVEIDVWLSPALALPPVPIGFIQQNADNPLAAMKKASEFSPMTAIFNITGQPAASVPTFWNGDNLPIGVQIVSKFGDETTLFQLAYQMEKVVKWEERVPAICAFKN
ncbi:MAG: amidase [Chitinophagales bacterium]